MGQQQLILLVLATVIVGIAIIIGIRAFTENGIRANSDAMVQDMVRMASDAQAWKQKPAPFGGQDVGVAKDAPGNYTGIGWIPLGYPDANPDALPPEPADGTYENLNGHFTIAAGAGGEAVITGCNVQKRNQVVLTVDGISDLDINQTLLEVGTSACVL